MSKAVRSKREAIGKTAQASKARAKVTFETFYASVYGEARWPKLREAMKGWAPKVALLNRNSKLTLEENFDDDTEVVPVEAPHSPLTMKNLEQHHHHIHHESGEEEKAKSEEAAPAAADDEKPKKTKKLQEFRLQCGLRFVTTPASEFDGQTQQHQPLPAVKRDPRGVPGCYHIDLASLLVVDAMQLEAYSKVCDLCAAPGGKSVAVAQVCNAPGELVSNEPDPARRGRLERVLHEYLGAGNAVPLPYRVSARDATTWFQNDYFDRVLVDAPCGSERHLIQQDETRTWSEDGAQHRAKTQTALLMRAFETVKVGGRVVYSTCSIHPIENDGVVVAALDKSRHNVRLEKLDAAAMMHAGEETECGGRLILPDRCSNIGPMFICAFTRLVGANPRHADLGSSSDSSSDDEDA